MRTLPALYLSVLMLAITAGCNSKSKTETIHRNTNADSVPTMLTRDVSTLISDSGITRYRITASLWLVFDQARVPVWRFPNGLLLEKFNSDYKTEATVVCDSAIYFKNSQIWRLDGNVNILNTAGEKFLTQQLFWDQRMNKMYSDSFIHIERADRTIEGLGFESNDRMTRYAIHNPTGIFPASDFQNKNKADSTSTAKTDTVSKSKPELPPVPQRNQGPVIRKKYDEKNNLIMHATIEPVS